MTDTNTMTVQEPGLLSTIQDQGRFGFEHIGVATAGAMDRDAMTTANLLVGNPEDTPVLEIQRVGPILKVNCERITLALAIDGELEIKGSMDATVPAGRSVSLRGGDTIAIQSVTTSCLAVHGGFQVPPILGSHSTFLRSKIGGLNGRPLAAGDDLSLSDRPFRDGQELMMSEAEFGLKKADGPLTLRAVPGPQDDHFTEESRQTFFREAYTISNISDRMGIRLEGPTLEHNDQGFNIASEPTAFGSVQVPGDGNPIILGVDRQTTGGYPKIATIVSADMYRLARLSPGQLVRFHRVTKAEAEASFLDHQAWQKGLPERLIPAPSLGGSIDMDALWSENLISGVVGPNSDKG